MSTKIYVTAEVEVKVVVKARVTLLVNADDDASVEKAVRDHFRGKTYLKADVTEDPRGNSLEILEIDDNVPPPDEYDQPSEYLVTAVGDLIENHHGRLVPHSVKVVD